MEGNGQHNPASSKQSDWAQWYILLGMVLVDREVREEAFKYLRTSSAPPQVQKMLVAIKCQDKPGAESAAREMDFGSEQDSFATGLIQAIRTRFENKQLREQLSNIGRMSLLVGSMDNEEILQKVKEMLDEA